MLSPCRSMSHLDHSAVSCADASSVLLHTSTLVMPQPGGASSGGATATTHQPFYAASPPRALSASYGDIFGGTLHFWLESVAARCRCDRVALFLPHPKHHTLVRVAVVGPTAPSVQQATSRASERGAETPGTAGPVTAAVLHAGIAANLYQVASEDAQDCPGSTAAKTALVCPIKPFHASATGASIGVIFCINKNGGSEVFTSDDQATVVAIAPSIAYLCETYPVDFAAYRFDAAPLHNVVSKHRATPKGPSHASASAQQHQHQHPHGRPPPAVQPHQLALPERPPMLVYEQAGSEAMLPYVALSLQNMAAANAANNAANNNKQGAVGGANRHVKGVGGDGSSPAATGTGLDERGHHQKSPNQQQQSQPSLTTAQQILSVGEFVTRMEQCWREAVSRCIGTERELTLRSAQVVDAHSILHRKQRRLEVLKDVLVETLDRRGGA